MSRLQVMPADRVPVGVGATPASLRVLGHDHAGIQSMISTGKATQALPLP